MAEYIKRMDTFSDEMCEGIDCGVCPFYNKAGENDCQVVAFLRSIPAADVREVKRGKWIPDYDYTEYDFDGSTPLPEPLKFQDGWQCSLCGGYTPSEANFCPNCGADMREES